MIFRFVIFAGFIAVALCQSSAATSSSAASVLPTCAQKCFNSTSTSTHGACSSVDIKCLCNNVDYINALACCLTSSCPASDQQKALSYNVNLCAGVGVTIPNYLGCGATAAASSGNNAGLTTQGSTSTQGGVQVLALPAHSIVPITISTAAAEVTYNGAPLLTGTCTSAQIASATLVGGTILQYPMQGCAGSNPGCCPFKVGQPGPLNSCPSDYFTTGGACCPSGWSVYPSALYGTQTPCYTVPAVAFVETTGVQRRVLLAPTMRRRAAATSLITTQLFTLRYPLSSSSSQLSTGAIVGISVGAAASVILFMIGFAFFIRRYRAIRNKQMEEPINTFVDQQFMGSDYDRRFSVVSADPYYAADAFRQLPMNELPDSASLPPLAENQLWFPQNGATESPVVHQLEARVPESALPTELPGDANMHAHHPAFGDAPNPTPPPETQEEKANTS